MPVLETPRQDTGTQDLPDSWADSGAYAPVPVKSRRARKVKKALRRAGKAVGNLILWIWRMIKFVLLMITGSIVVFFILDRVAPDAIKDFTTTITTEVGKRTPPLVDMIPGGNALQGIVVPDIGIRIGWPPPGLESTGAPLGTPSALPADSGSYAFLATSPGQDFVSYDPCRPIHYVTRPDNAPTGGDQLIAEAIAEASRASGFVFINDGATTEASANRRASYQPERYGDRWAPVLFTWDTEAEQPRFTNDWTAGNENILGIGGSSMRTVLNQTSTYVTGQVRLNAAALTGMASTPGGRDEVRGVIAHEVAHVLGLAHVEDDTQLMAPSTAGVFTFQAGDLAGLARLGTGPCQAGV